MASFLDWKFEKQLTPVLMTLVNGLVIILTILAGVISIGAGVFFLLRGGEVGGLFIVGGLLGMLAVILVSRLIHEVAIVAFRIAAVSKEVRILLSQHARVPARPSVPQRPGGVSSSAPPPLPRM